VREREVANRTREAGHLDEIQGIVANTLKLFRTGAACRVFIFALVGFINGLDALMLTSPPTDSVNIEIMAGYNFSAIILVHLFEQLPFTSRIAAFFSSELIATWIRAVVKN
jgi:hypothetical protein